MFRYLAIFSLLLHASYALAQDLKPPKTLSCLDRTALTELPLLNRTLRPHSKESTLESLVANFRATTGLAISVIEPPETNIIDFQTQQETLADSLNRLLSAYPELTCRIIRHHLIIFPAGDLFKKTVKGVSIRNVYRYAAARRYVGRLAAELPEFKSWSFDGGYSGLVDDPLLTEKVTLEAEAPIIVHLAELLGSYEPSYFSVTTVASGGRILVFGSTGIMSDGSVPTLRRKAVRPK